MAKKLREGDIFSIQISEDQYSVGCVASRWRKEFYFVLFEEIFQFSHLPESVFGLTPCIASSSLDAKIHHGHWVVYANDSNEVNFPQPLYKVEESTGYVVESFDRKTRYKLNRENAGNFKYRKCVAPVRLEKAIKAFHGFEEWVEMFDELRYERLVFSILGDI